MDDEPEAKIFLIDTILMYGKIVTLELAYGHTFSQLLLQNNNQYWESC
jgi:hypothetical protein